MRGFCLLECTCCTSNGVPQHAAGEDDDMKTREPLGISLVIIGEAARSQQFPL